MPWKEFKQIIECKKPAGRPKIGDNILPPVTVPSSIKEDLKYLSAVLEKSVPALRREAYRLLINQHKV